MHGIASKLLIFFGFVTVKLQILRKGFQKKGKLPTLMDKHPPPP